MTRTKHPTDRAERLKLKKIKFDSKQKGKTPSVWTDFQTGKIKRLKKEAIKNQETEDDLANYRSSGVVE